MRDRMPDVGTELVTVVELIEHLAGREGGVTIFRTLENGQWHYAVQTGDPVDRVGYGDRLAEAVLRVTA